MTPSPVSAALAQARDLAVDFFFPSRCIVCNASGPHLCAACVDAFQPADGLRCSRCWAPSRPGLCRRCARYEPHFRQLRAAFVFDGAVRAAIHGLKYRGLRAAVEPLIEAAWPPQAGAGAHLVTTVPMSGWHRRRRGYNQAELLARAAAERLQLPFEAAALRRVRRSRRQAQLDLEARAANVEGVFRADAAIVEGRVVLVIDDVTTTGATLDACAEALRDVGAVAVDVWALARED